MATDAKQPEQDESEPGCLEYAVIIAVLIPTVIIMLVLGKFDKDKVADLMRGTRGEDE